MLVEKINAAPLEQCLSESFSPFPAYSERARWNSLPADIRAHYTRIGRELKNKPWDSLPASYYLAFARTGDRVMYESLYFQRRSDLFSLVLAECMEGEKEYLGDIINGVWLICEESTWVVPAHNTSAGEIANLEAPVFIDLFSAETASLLSWVYALTGELLPPLVRRRIEIAIEQRIIRPFLDSDHFWWMGFQTERPVNNWNPWINSNILVAFLVFAKDLDTRLQGVEKAVRSIDRFISSYDEDGGCDEGPGYFGVAGASLFDFLEELYLATNGIIDIYGHEKIQNIARYIGKVYINESYYVNFADAHARVPIPAALLYRVGDRMRDETLTSFAAHILRNQYTGAPYKSGSSTFFRTLSNIFDSRSWENDSVKKFTAPAVSWFKGIQVLTAREGEDTAKGMFIAAKGGHNAESHNHNDIGNFIVYHDGKPVVIDAGVETYSRKTFSDERYGIWTMQSCWHNTPTINGYTQLPGENFKAAAVSFEENGNTATLSMDIRNAYPAGASIRRYGRTFVFAPGSSFTVTDSYSLEKCDLPLAVHILCYNRPVIEYGLVRLGSSVALHFDSELFNVDSEEIALTDQTLRSDWGKDTLYRLCFTQKELRTDGVFTFRFTRCEDHS